MGRTGRSGARLGSLGALLGAVVVLATAPAAQAIDATYTVPVTNPNPNANCFPFGTTNAVPNWKPFMAFFYRNIPAFELRKGDSLAFDLIAPNDVPITQDIAMAPTTISGGNVPAVPFQTIVAAGEFASSFLGNDTTGDYELSYTASNPTPFKFPAGGLAIRFFSASLIDSTCTGVLRGNSGGGFDQFASRAFRDPDGTAPWAEFDSQSIAGFRLTLRRTCRGKPATVVGAGNALIEGTPGPDVISGGDGSTTINGGGGKDLICGEEGKDELLGGRASDQLDGGPGKDLVNGGTGADRMFGGGGKDRCVGGKGVDRAKGCENTISLR